MIILDVHTCIIASRERSFLWEALTHCSYSPHQKLTNSYERLEFLGDAVIDFLVTCHLFSEHPGIEPGKLTNLRSALVNNNTLARISVERRLYTHLLYNSPRQGLHCDRNPNNRS